MRFTLNYRLLGLKKKTRVSTNSTAPGFCANPAILIAFQKKNEKIFIPTDPKMFQKIGQKA